MRPGFIAYSAVLSCVFLLEMHVPMYFSQLQSLSNIFLPASHPTTPSGDPELAPDLLASTLLLVLHSSSPITEANITYATRQANLVLVGVIITGSIRRVLQGAARALRATPASRNRVASLVLLVLAQLMVRVRGLQLLIIIAELAPPLRAYTSSRRSCSSARRSHLLWTGRTLAYLRRCLLMRRLGLCLIGASS